LTDPSRTFLLDTSVVIALLRGNEFGRHLESTYALSRQGFVLISPVTLGEAHSLAVRWQWTAERVAQLEKQLASFVILDLRQPTIVRAYVDIREKLRLRAGGSQENRGENDLWIAACAVAAGVPVLTADKDFLVFEHPGLQVEFVDPAPFKARLRDGAPE